MTVVQSDGPLKLVRRQQWPGYTFVLRCEDCRTVETFGHRVDAEDAFDRHDHGG